MKLYKRFTGIDEEGVEVYHENVPTLITLNDCCVAETDHCKNRGKYVKQDKYITRKTNSPQYEVLMQNATNVISLFYASGVQKLLIS